MDCVLPRRGVLVLFLAASAGGCGGSEAAAPLEACSGPVELQVGESTTPTFSWTPRCGVAMIAVEDLSVPEGYYGHIWALAATDDRIAPGVRYGSRPAGTVQLGLEVVPLRVGQEYRVSVGRTDGAGGTETVGTATFTP